MKNNIVKSKSFAFAVRIVRLYQFLVDSKKEFILSKQLLRSGTSVGVKVRKVECFELNMIYSNINIKNKSLTFSFN